MNIKTKFNVGDKVKFFRENVGYYHGSIKSFQIWGNNNETVITYIIETGDKSIRAHEDCIEID